jgi:hypothetical protein
MVIGVAGLPKTYLSGTPDCGEKINVPVRFVCIGVRPPVFRPS